MAKTPKREKYFHWIGEVTTYQIGFVKLSSRSDINITKNEQAKQYKIAVQGYDLAAQRLTEHGYTVVHTSDINKSYQLLMSGKVDLIIDDKNNAVMLAQSP